MVKFAEKFVVLVDIAGVMGFEKLVHFFTAFSNLERKQRKKLLQWPVKDLSAFKDESKAKMLHQANKTELKLELRSC